MAFSLSKPDLNLAEKIFVGIDNGLQGAVVAIDQNCKLLGWFDTPLVALTKTGKKKKTSKLEFVPSNMATILRQFPIQKTYIYMEIAHAMPEQGLSSTFKTGQGFGLWEGLTAGIGFRYEIVHAKTWAKDVLKDVPRGDTKERSMLKCGRCFPDLPLTRPKGSKLCMDGRADAAMIAYYGWMHFNQADDVFKIKRTPILRKRADNVGPKKEEKERRSNPH